MKELVKRLVRRGLRKAASGSGVREQLAGIGRQLAAIRTMLTQQDRALELHRGDIQAGLAQQGAASSQSWQLLLSLQQQLADLKQQGAAEAAAANKGVQLLLSLHYRQLLGPAPLRLTFDDVEYRCSSQTGEDGILLYLFSLLGTTNKRCVELCAGDGVECNTANLIINHGWRGLLLDGDEALIARGREFYAKCRDTFILPPTLASAWITAGNVNALIAQHGFTGEIDLLSLDMDGVDYWVWKALDCIRPRVVVLEFQGIWGPSTAVTVPYREDFRCDFTRHPYYYCGASLPAFAKLGREKGYRLVGIHRIGFNAFFVRDGVGENALPGLSTAECFARHRRLKEWSPAWVPNTEGRVWDWQEV
jgi:hypothetical protein